MVRSKKGRQRLRLAALLIIAGSMGYALVWAAGWRGADPPAPAASQHLPASRPGLDDQGLPLYAYAGMAPTLTPPFEGAGYYGWPGRRVEGIPPIGIYQPAGGDTVFALPTPTLTPTPSPTITPIPSRTPRPAASFTPTPTYSPPPTVTPPATFTPFAQIIKDCAPAGWPASGILTQYYRWYHRAIDIAMPTGTAVVATHSGEVMFAGWRTDGYGMLIILQNGPYITYYGHLSNVNVTQGTWVERGSMIGWSGSSGNSSGPHLHYEIRVNDAEVDPLAFEQEGHPPC